MFIMNTSAEKLRERYAELNTDELLHIRVTADLTEKAKSLLEAELSNRHVGESDYQEVKEIQEYFDSERDEVERKIKRRLKGMLVFWGFVFACVFALLGLLYSWRIS